MHICRDIPKIIHPLAPFHTRVKVAKILYQALFAMSISKNSPGVLGNNMFGPIAETINQAAEILIKRPDNVLKRGRGSLLTRFIFTNGD